MLVTHRKVSERLHPFSHETDTLGLSLPFLSHPPLHQRILGCASDGRIWQPRERSLSSDSECSTASHSILVSDASFHSADADAEMGGTGDSSLRWNGPLGVGLPIVDTLAPIFDSNESQHMSFGSPRGGPYLGAEDDLGGATSGTCASLVAPRGVTVSDHLTLSLNLQAIPCSTKLGPSRAAK